MKATSEVNVLFCCYPRVSEASRLKQLEDENAKLKRLLAEAMLDNATLKDLMTKKF
jgi:putative transposase